jgi:hypothetical protein
MNTKSSRRVLIVGALAIAASIGAVVRHVSPENSTAHSLGTLFMVMWVPIVGNIVFFFARRWRPIGLAPKIFAIGTPFTPHALVEISLPRQESSNHSAQVSAGELRCLFVTGTEGFSARVQVPQEAVGGKATTVQAEFLAPAAALPKLSASGAFQLIQGGSVVGHGRVVSMLPNA